MPKVKRTLAQEVEALKKAVRSIKKDVNDLKPVIKAIVRQYAKEKESCIGFERDHLIEPELEEIEDGEIYAPQ